MKCCRQLLNLFYLWNGQPSQATNASASAQPSPPAVFTAVIATTEVLAAWTHAFGQLVIPEPTSSAKAQAKMMSILVKSVVEQMWVRCSP